MSAEKPVSINPGTYPVLRIALLYALGIVTGRGLSSHLQVDYVFTGVCIAVVLCAILHYRRSALRGSAMPTLYLLCLFGFGILHIRIHDQPITPQEHLLEVFEEDQLLFHGVVHSERTTRSGHRMLRIEIDSVQIHGLPNWHISFKTEALIRKETFDTWISDNTNASDESGFGMPGNYLCFNGDLVIPDKPVNPHQFDYAAFLERQNIYTTVFISHLQDVEPHQGISFWLHRQIKVQSQVQNLFSKHNSGLAKAILLGDRSDLDPDLRNAFSRAGLAHLMAVSGMHVGFVLLPVWFILPWFRRSYSGRATGLILSGLLLLIYAGVTGFSVSVSRASLMAFFMILARLFHKPGTSMNILGFAGLLLLLYDPAMLFDVGFQLSFLAVIIILTTLPGTRYLLPPRHRYRKTGAVFQFVMVSVLVQGGLYPVLITYFQEFSIAGPISNTLAVPFVQLMFLWSFFCLFVAEVHASFASLLNTPAEIILTGLTAYVNRIGSSPASWIESTLPGPWLFGVWFFGTGVVGSLRIPTIRWRMVCAFMICLVIFQATQIFDNQLKKPELRLTFFDVGQADAILLATPGNRHYLYDTGVWTPGYDSGERVLLPELKAMGIKHLDGVILSHPHADHIGGVISLMETIPIDTIYQSPVAYDSRLYHRYMQTAFEKGIPVRLLESGDIIHTDPAMPVKILGPSSGISAHDPNNQSVVMTVRYGENRILFAGDAEKEAESYLADTFGTFLESDILKVGHHASRTSSTSRFLKYVNASHGVASLGLRNRHRHPHQEAVTRLHDSGTSVRFTSLEGAIIFSCDGDKCTNEP